MSSFITPVITACSTIFSCISPVVTICTSIFNSAFPHLRDHVLDFHRNVQDFRSKKKELQAIKETYRQNRADKKPSPRMELWNRGYEEIINRCGQIENELADNERRSCCSIERFRLSQKVVESTRKMNDHIDRYNQLGSSEMFVDQPTVERQMPDYIPNLRSVEEIKKAIHEAIERCTMIGLWGMGGIGKTTLMKKIFNELDEEKKFKHVVMVVVSQNPDIKNIQDTIGHKLQLNWGDSKLVKNWKESTATYIKASRISKRLKQIRSTLIIFDDVWERLKLRDIGIPDESEGCCKIVLTTRNLEVCNQMRAEQAIKMNVLSEDEAWDLFKTNAVINDNVVPEIKEVAEKVCKECAGLPLAISVVAKALEGESEYSKWCQNLKYLEDGDPVFLKGVYTPLKLSYDRLPRKELQRAFLLCSIFPEDHEITLKELICYGIGAGEIYNNYKGKDRYDAYQNIFIDLKRRGLLQDVVEEAEYQKQYSARMHDVVRKIAIDIAKEEFEGSFNQEGLMEWISSSVIDDDDDDGPPPPNVKKMKFLSLKSGKELKRFHPDFFNGMEDVLLLNLIGKRSSGLTLTTTSNIWKLKNLRALMLRRIAVNVENLHFLHNLSVLRLQSVHIEELNQEFFAKLVYLRVIDFTDTEIDIIRPKTFSSLKSKLEVLHMLGSFTKWQAFNEEDGDLVAFVELTYLKNLYSLEVLIDDERIFSDEHSPDFVFPSSVEEFIIAPPGFYDRFSPWTSQELGLPDIQLNNAAKWVKSLFEKTKAINMDLKNSAADVIISNSSNINAVLEEEYCSKAMCNLEFLRLYSLSASNKSVDHNLPDVPFQRLKVIRIDGCNGMKFIFPWNVAVCLLQLEHLIIYRCSQLEVIIRKDESDYKDESVCGFQAQVLFPKLKDMYLRELPNLESLWQQQSPERMEMEWSTSLQVLSVINCKKLKRLFLGEKSAPMLKIFECEKEWYDELHWEDEQAASQFDEIVDHEIVDSDSDSDSE